MMAVDALLSAAETSALSGFIQEPIPRCHRGADPVFAPWTQAGGGGPPMLWEYAGHLYEDGWRARAGFVARQEVVHVGCDELPRLLAVKRDGRTPPGVVTLRRPCSPCVDSFTRR